MTRCRPAGPRRAFHPPQHCRGAWLLAWLLLVGPPGCARSGFDPRPVAGAADAGGLDPHDPPTLDGATVASDSDFAASLRPDASTAGDGAPHPSVVLDYVFGAEGNERVNALAMDAAGHIYLAGAFESGAIDFLGVPLGDGGSADALVAHFDAKGELIWVRAFGGLGAEEAESIAVDDAGNIYVGGYLGSPVTLQQEAIPHAGAWDGFVLSFDPTGALRWVRSIAGPGDDIVWNVAVGKRVVGVVGEVGDGIDFGRGPLATKGGSDAFVARYDADSGALSSAELVSSDGGFERSLAVEVDAEDNLFAGATFAGTLTAFGRSMTSTGDYDGLIIALDAAGRWRWGAGLGGASSDEVTALALDGDTLYVAGASLHPSGGGAGFVGAMQVGDGTQGWWIELQATTGARFWGLCAKDGVVHAVGAFEAEALWANARHVAVGGSDIAWASVAASGAPRPLITAGSERTETAYAIACGAHGRVALGGYLQGGLDFGGGAMASAGGDDGYLVVFNP